MICEKKQRALLHKVNSELVEFFVRTRRYVADWNEETHWGSDDSFIEHIYFLDDERRLKIMIRNEESGPGWTCERCEGEGGFYAPP